MSTPLDTAATRDVVITKPGRPTVTYGPMTEQHARDFLDGLLAQMHNTAHPDGTEIRLAPHTATCEHDPFNRDDYRDPETLADMAQPEPGGGIDFPDTYSRLVALAGHSRAGELWHAACDVMDSRGADEQRVKDLEQLTRELPEILRTAEAEVVRAMQVLGRLCSDQVYDEELLGRPAADMTADLDDAARRIRSAARIANLRRMAWAREG